MMIFDELVVMMWLIVKLSNGMVATTLDNQWQP
jgi:hypothetical protein